MTTISLSAIPNAIATAEQLAAYTGLLLARINPSLSILETDTAYQQAAQAQIFKAADNSTRLLLRVSLPLDPAFSSDRSKKLWLFAQEFPGNVAIPDTFLAN